MSWCGLRPLVVYTKSLNKAILDFIILAILRVWERCRGKRKKQEMKQWISALAINDKSNQLPVLIKAIKTKLLFINVGGRSSRVV